MTDIKEISEPEEMKKIFPVASSAWGMEKPESLISDVLNAMRFHGGLVLGAYDGERLIGFQFSFIGRKNSTFYLYSHMTGVLEEKKYAGTGFMLKTAQKEWAMQKGYSIVVWTFDPLMSLNGNFNIRKLGAIGRTYLVNFYGTMTDRLNTGVETDRFVAEWWIHRNRVPSAFEPEQYARADETVEIASGMRRITSISFPDENSVVVEIPADFIAVKKHSLELAAEWREKTRQIFRTMFMRGYAVTSFTGADGRSYYLLERGASAAGYCGERVFTQE
ncbi:MAG: hypothetical protein KIS30_06110 [Thermoplasmata archaeon]|nr:hypothetical protein [Candidatus Sysuiplasma acidicola]MBX8646311.1 hypothetical protein [Candidatus Sysuiplasma acidicola]